MIVWVVTVEPGFYVVEPTNGVPNGVADRDALGERVDGHDDHHQEHLPRAFALRGLEHQLLLVPMAEGVLGHQDEDDPDQRPDHRLHPPVGGPLRHEPEAGPQHEPRGDRIGVGDGPLGQIPHEEERQRAEAGGQGGGEGVEEDEDDVAQTASTSSTTIPMASAVTTAMLVWPAWRYDSGSSSTRTR